MRCQDVLVEVNESTDALFAVVGSHSGEDVTFDTTSASGSLILKGVRTAMSYIHMLCEKRELDAWWCTEDSLYYCCVPVAIVHSEQADIDMAAKIVENMLAFLRFERPRLQSASPDSSTLRRTTAKAIIESITSIDTQLAWHLIQMCSDVRPTAISDAAVAPPPPDAATAARCTEAVQDIDLIADKLSSIFGDSIDRMFVSYMPLRVCLYIWDQCLLSSLKDAVPLASACALVCVRRYILRAESITAVQRAFREQLRVLQLNTFQRMFEKLFCSVLRSAVGSSLACCLGICSQPKKACLQTGLRLTRGMPPKEQQRGSKCGSFCNHTRPFPQQCRHRHTTSLQHWCPRQLREP